MPKRDAIKNNAQLFADQLLHFKSELPQYATLLGVSSTQTTAQAADADRFNYEVICQVAAADAAEGWTTWRNLTRSGGAYPPGGAPLPPVLPTPEPAPVAPGVEARFRALVALIKKHPNYNPAIGTALGIEGNQHSRPDMATVKPAVRPELTGGQVLLRWGWQGNGAFLTACEIEVDRDDGAGMRLLTIDTTPNYTDTQPMPATAKTWKYRAIYREGDGRVGQWSDVVSINVGA